MGFPSKQQVLEAAKHLAIKDEGVFVRTNGLWHVLIFLRHRACHGANSQYTFESYDLAQAAFDLNGVTLPVVEESRDVYFEPGATQGNEFQKLFRHREGPRQTYLNRIYTGLVGSGPRQPKLFDASNNALPTTVNLVGDWIKVLRSLGDNKLVLDSRIQSLMAWLFRFGIPGQRGHSSHLTEHTGNGRLKAAAGVVQSPIPAAKQEFQAELAKFFGLTEQELKSLFPELGGVDPAVWAEASAISTASLGAELLSFLDVGKTVGNAENDGLAELADTFIAAAERNAKLRVESPIVTRLAGSLLSKRFLILTGLAGSGKTKLAQALAWWITPEADNDGGAQPCFSVVPVGADWTGNENVLGYPNGLDKETYISKPALDLIIHAGAHEDVPHFLILDEMNMSHVERYFADILSMIESGEELILYSGDLGKPEAWRQTAAAKRVPPKLKHLPENLFIIGTVNVDETTYMFSPKVLDRANVIEFRMDASELAGFLGNPAKPDLAKLDGKGASFGKAFVDAAKNPVAVPADVKAEYDAEMLLFFKTLQAHGAEFGYRTAYETARFTHFYKLLGNHPDGDATWFPGAFDCVVFQKLLPKLHGSRAKLGPVLKKLWFLCVNDAAGRGADALKAAEEAARSTDKKAEPSVVVPAGAPYPLSAEKIGRMWRLLIENGFASFAEA
jgi:energy-coupling factor transporter ATP-binding protein EcfA2